MEKERRRWRRKGDEVADGGEVQRVVGKQSGPIDRGGSNGEGGWEGCLRSTLVGCFIENPGVLGAYR